MQEQHIKILLVEDDPDDVWLLRSSLSDRWEGTFELVHVELLAAAVERCEEDRFDIVLLDLHLPDSIGLETFFTLHAHAADMPIVILSNFGDEATCVKAVQAGAQDYLVKRDVTDRILVRSIRYALERSRRHRMQESLKASPDRFSVAEEFHQRLNPNRPPTLSGFDIAGAIQPAKQRTGNYFDYIPMFDHCLGVVIGDIGNRSMDSALLISAARACLRTLAQSCTDVGDILTRANRMLAADSQDFQSVALAMSRIDPKTKTLSFAGAGQRGYLLHPAIEVSILEPTSPPLAARADTVVPTAAPISLQPGDLLAFFSRGLASAESPDHTCFGVARALQTIRSERDKPAARIIDSLRKEVSEFCCNQPQQNDMTMVVVKVMEG